ncbi:hypothetical protein NC653_035970 [Populus alba x Populus x berolinensis]|uniref:Uncharacterized protein n=1 Tax=Populus alba x Populus x berolinensis TaxID=444605 RepID=A0AAD6PVV1_9ROSI|nr:hypothetical protein NC653_035970 [Populus alba x Populus x berolinensis]
MGLPCVGAAGGSFGAKGYERSGKMVRRPAGCAAAGAGEDRSTPMMVYGQWSSSLEAVAGFFGGRRC